MLLRLLRGWLLLLGGLIAGAGLCLHGQIAVARHVRDEVQGTFFLWRGIGQITFVFQDEATQTALWMNEVPDEAMRQSDAAAWTLVAIGGVLAASAPFVRRNTERRRR